MAETLADLLDRGLPEETVLPLMTVNVANLLRLPGKGRVETGFDADLVVLGEDNRVNSVMAGGRWQVRNNKQVVRGLFES